MMGRGELHALVADVLGPAARADAIETILLAADAYVEDSILRAPIRRYLVDICEAIDGPGYEARREYLTEWGTP